MENICAYRFQGQGVADGDKDPIKRFNDNSYGTFNGSDVKVVNDDQVKSLKEDRVEWIMTRMNHIYKCEDQEYLAGITKHYDDVVNQALISNFKGIESRNIEKLERVESTLCTLIRFGKGAVVGAGLASFWGLYFETIAPMALINCALAGGGLGAATCLSFKYNGLPHKDAWFGALVESKCQDLFLKKCPDMQDIVKLEAEVTRIGCPLGGGGAENYANMVSLILDGTVRRDKIIKPFQNGKMMICLFSYLEHARQRCDFIQKGEGMDRSYIPIKMKHPLIEMDVYEA